MRTTNVRRFQGVGGRRQCRGGGVGWGGNDNPRMPMARGCRRNTDRDFALVYVELEHDLRQNRTRRFQNMLRAPKRSLPPRMHPPAESLRIGHLPVAGGQLAGRH